MRRKYFGLAMAAVATLGPAQAFGGDREIAQSISERLQVSRDAGKLKGFSLDMKVDEGVVLFQGKVSGEQQRAIVLATSEGIEGIQRVVDKLEVTPEQVATSKPAKIYKPKSAAITVAADESADPEVGNFNFAGALASPASQSTEKGMSLPEQNLASSDSRPLPAAPVVQATREVQEVVPGIVLPTAAYEGGELEMPIPEPVTDATAVAVASAPRAVHSTIDDATIAQSVVRAIGRAQAEGYLKHFGVDVQSYDGVIEIEGNAASQQQSEFLETIARHAPGARDVRNRIKITAESNPAGGNTAARPVTHRSSSPSMGAAMPQPHSGLQPLPAGNRVAGSAMQPIRQAPQMPASMQMQPRMPQQMPPQMRQGGVPAQMTAYNQSQGGQQIINGEMVVPGSMANHGASGGAYCPPGAGGGAPMMGQPVPMAPAAGVGAPRYDSPNLPNYAWPGYAAHPNYAALSYPQQYSPSAFPFIGPFYPYPQVPLGWRKVSLEWDDGWWFLDFTDK